MRTIRIVLVSVLAVAMTAPALAADRWTVRLEGVRAHTSKEVGNGSDGAGTFAFEDGNGLGLGLEYSLSDRLGVDLFYSRTELDAEVRGPAPVEESLSNELSLDLVSLGMAFDLLPKHRIDLNLMPTLNYVRFGEMDGNIPGMFCGPGVFCMYHLDFDSDVALGATLGLGVPLGGSAVELAASVRYVDSQANDSSLPQTVLTLGCGGRF